MNNIHKIADWIEEGIVLYFPKDRISWTQEDYKKLMYHVMQKSKGHFPPKFIEQCINFVIHI